MRRQPNDSDWSASAGLRGRRPGTAAGSGAADRGADPGRRNRTADGDTREHPRPEARDGGLRLPLRRRPRRPGPVPAVPDLRQGAFIERFKFNKETESWLFNANANNVGYRDQQFGASYRDIGKLKVDFDWTQVPLYISGDTRSLYTDAGNGRMVIDDAIQQAFQNAGAADGAGDGRPDDQHAAGGAPSFDMRNRRDIAASTWCTR